VKVERKKTGKVEERELKKSWTHGRTDGHSDDFILCPMLCIALDRQLILLIFYFCVAYVACVKLAHPALRTLLGFKPADTYCRCHVGERQTAVQTRAPVLLTSSQHRTKNSAFHPLNSWSVETTISMKDRWSEAADDCRLCSVNACRPLHTIQVTTAQYYHVILQGTSLLQCSSNGE